LQSARPVQVVVVVASLPGPVQVLMWWRLSFVVV
jgi:hypothetical protein